MNQIKDIAEKFLKAEKVSEKNALILGSLGLTHSAGDIAGMAYGVNFSQHLFNDERKAALAEYLGYAMLNWQILAATAGLSTDEIERRFVATWQTKQAQTVGQASIKDLLKHLKPTVKQETTAQQEQVNAKPTEVNFTRQS